MYTIIVYYYICFCTFCRSAIPTSCYISNVFSTEQQPSISSIDVERRRQSLRSSLSEPSYFTCEKLKTVGENFMVLELDNVGNLNHYYMIVSPHNSFNKNEFTALQR